MAAPAKCIEVPNEDRAELERIARSATEQVRMVERAQIVLLAAEGLSASRIGRAWAARRSVKRKWRARYERDGLDGLRDRPRSGRPLAHGPEVRARLIAKACTRPEPTEQGARRGRFTYRELGEAVGMS